MTEQEILFYLEGKDDQGLFAKAQSVRQQIFGREVYLRAIIEFSNFCNKKCHYCGLRAPNGELTRYRLSDKQILETAFLAISEGAGTIVLQSGDDTGYSMQTIGNLVREIKNHNDVAVTLSVGDRELDEYEYWRSCGADRFLLKLETSSASLYSQLREGAEFSARLHRLQSLRNMGYEIGSGIIVGLPGSDLTSILSDILFLTDLDLDMIATGPFLPHPQTPLAQSRPGDIFLAHRVSAVLRILNPYANIPATSALSALHPKQRKLALSRECNVLMPSMTPAQCRRDYNIYPGKNESFPGATHSLDRAKKMILSLGLVPSSSKGYSKRTHHV